MNVLRNFTILVAFYGKFATFSDSEKIQYFFFEKPIYFFKKTQILNVLINFFTLVAFYGTFATFSDPEKIQYFFSKNPSVFLKKKTNFWTFWEILLFQSHFTANLLPLAILKKLNLFSRKTHLLFFKKNPNFERFEKLYNLSRILRLFCYL